MRVSSVFLLGLGTTLGIDDATPTVAWKLTADTNGEQQVAYEIQVGTSLDASDIYASGRVAGRAQRYEIRSQLSSATQYFVRVRSWSTATIVTDWSALIFETGLFSLAGWRQAQWIGRPGQFTPQLRKVINLSQPISKARLYVSAGGYVDFKINGTTVSQPLEPGFTTYTKRIQYVTHDVTSALSTGNNALSATLGRGFFGVTTATDWKWNQSAWNGDPRMLALLAVTFADGTTQYTTSDATWKTTTGPTVADSVYLGDIYNSTLETAGWELASYNDASWSAASVMTPPAGALVAQNQPPITKGTPIQGTLQAWGPQPNTQQRVNFGKVISGWVRITFSATRGETVTLTYGEKVNSDGTLFTYNQHVTGITQQDRIIARGGPQVWEPKFSWKGFQYVYIGGAAGATVSAIEAIPVSTELPRIGTWTSSSAALNQLHGMSLQSFIINAHGVQSDTPMYERNGWLGDYDKMFDSASYGFDMAGYARKTLLDMADSLGDNGVLPVLAPHPGPGLFEGAGPEWTAAFVLIAHKLYTHTGDKSFIAQIYSKMKLYVDTMLAASPANQWTSSYGDWASPAGNGAPGTGYDMTATTFVMRQTASLAYMASELGDTAAATAYNTRVDQIKAAINSRLYNSTTKIYKPNATWDGEFRQTNNVLALRHKIAPTADRAAVAAVLENDVRVTKDNHLNTGIVGSEHLLSVLTEFGYIDTALAVALQTTYPSWGQWASAGATTTWNSYGTALSTRSLSHHMHGTYVAWMYQYLAGILISGPDSVTIKPYVPSSGLSVVEASVDTIMGKVSTKRNANSMTVEIPPGITATYNQTTLPSGTTVITL